jgi:hypothetical protein
MAEAARIEPAGALEGIGSSDCGISLAFNLEVNGAEIFRLTSPLL